MRHFLLTYIRPALKKIGLYSVFHHLYFLLYKIKNTTVNFLIRLTQKTAVIVLYHRVGSVSADPVLLNVDQKTFEEHLNFYKKFYEIVSLSELNTRLIEDKINGRELAITFDDGYVDNLTLALPILEKHNLPVTIFVTTSQLGLKAHHPWDMNYNEQDRACFVDEAQLQLLATNPLVTIGAHTHTHPLLSSQTKDQQASDILLGKNILERITGKTINYFAYPFGGTYDINTSSIESVQELGFSFAYLNDQKFVRRTSTKFTIPRFNIRNYSINKLALKLITLPYLWWKIKDTIGLTKAKCETTYWRLRQGHRRKLHKLVAIEPCYWLYNKLRKDSIVVDVGTGYTADFSLALIEKFGVRSVGIDPTKKHREHLTKIASTVPNFSYYQYALGSTHEKLHFFESVHGESGSVFDTHVNSKTAGVQSYEVESVTIDDIIELLKVPKIDLFKMDIEGSEYAVLDSISPTTLAKINQLVVEFHHGTVSNYTQNDTRRIRNKLQNEGFVEFTEDGINYLFFRP